jgi:hypothetical protein
VSGQNRVRGSRPEREAVLREDAPVECALLEDPALNSKDERLCRLAAAASERRLAVSKQRHAVPSHLARASAPVRGPARAVDDPRLVGAAKAAAQAVPQAPAAPCSPKPAGAADADLSARRCQVDRPVNDSFPGAVAVNRHIKIRAAPPRGEAACIP